MEQPQAEPPAPSKASSVETVESEKHEALSGPEKNPQDKPRDKGGAEADGAAGEQEPEDQALPPAEDADSGNLECPPPEASSSTCGTSPETETREMSSKPQELPQSPRTQQPDLDLYCVKWIPWKGERTPIITQSTNGPCPLLAIMNILFLQWKVRTELSQWTVRHWAIKMSIDLPLKCAWFIHTNGPYNTVLYRGYCGLERWLSS